MAKEQSRQQLTEDISRHAAESSSVYRTSKGTKQRRFRKYINTASHYPKVSSALTCQKAEIFIEVLCLGLGPFPVALNWKLPGKSLSHIPNNFILWSSFSRLERDDYRRKHVPSVERLLGSGEGGVFRKGHQRTISFDVTSFSNAYVIHGCVFMWIYVY